MEIKLSDETMIGLKRLFNQSLVNADSFNQLVNVYTSAGPISRNKENRDLDTQKSDVLKTAYAALVILLTEAARHDMDLLKLKTFLQGFNFDLSRITVISNAYDEQKPKMQKRLLAVGTNLPHIVDFSWRLDYRIKSDYVGNPIIEPCVLVELVTVTSSNNNKIVKFVCSLQGLQELVFALRGAAKHINKMVNPSK